MKITVNNAAMNYVERGTPGGTPIIFVHGFPFNQEMWDPQMRALPNYYRAIAYDVRGHGQSEVGDGQYTIELFVDDLFALMDHLVVKKAVVCGLSMGGYIALRAIEREPERFAAIVLCDTKSEGESDEGKLKRAATLKSVKTLGVPQFAGGFLKAVFAEGTFASNPAVVEKVRSMIQNNSPIGIGGTILALASRTDTTGALGRIKVPSLILCGESDSLTPPKQSELLHAKIEHSVYHVIPRAAHLSNLENPNAFNEKLIGFLKSLS